MDDDKKTLTIEVWDFWKLCPELPFIINKAVDQGLCITINYHARTQEDLTQISIVHDMIRQAGIPYELNVSFARPQVKTEADFSC